MPRFTLILAALFFLLIAGVVSCGYGIQPASLDEDTSQVVASSVTSGPPLETKKPTSTPNSANIDFYQIYQEVDRLAAIAWQTLEIFIYQHSPRESATDQERTAARFLLGQFETLGMEVNFQEFTVELLSRKTPVLSIVGSEEDVFNGFPLKLSSEGQVTGVLQYVGLAPTEEKTLFDVDGKIALIRRGGLTFQSKVRNVEETGAIGAIIYNDRPGEFSGRLTNRSRIPVISVSQENGEIIKALMSESDVTGEVSVLMETANSSNVIAKMPSTNPNGRVVILGAHYDTVPNTQGANDNGSGVAVLITIANEVVGKTFPFDLHFVLFGSEEIGLFGSRYFVDSLSQTERDAVVAMLNFDVPGSGNFIEVIGDQHLVDFSVNYGKTNGIEVHLGKPLEGASSDHAPFKDVGIPVVFLLADDLKLINSPDDTIEFVKPELLGRASLIGLALLDALARQF